MKRKEVLDYLNSKPFLEQAKQNIDELGIIINDIISTPVSQLDATQNNLNRLSLSVTDGVKEGE